MIFRLILVSFVLFNLCVYANSEFEIHSNEVIRAVKTNNIIKVDGLMDPVWNQTQSHSNFIQLDPFPFEQPSKQTEFRILYNEENIFFYIKAFDNPKEITTIEGKRDINQHLTDWLKISLDPLNEKTTAYAFIVNPSNVQNDCRIYNGGNSNDFKWDAIWESATTITKDGWIAEIKIPLNILKFQNSEIQDWGINIGRHIYREQQQSLFQIKDADAGHLISNYAMLSNLENLKSKNNLVITPSVTSTFDSDDNYDPTQYNRTFGADLRYNINSKNTLLLTLVPDFAQIEADPDVINISDYPVYLREKRPFFLEGDDVFYTYEELYYSRRMARPKVGAKFIGSSNNIDYGVMYVKNEGFNDDVSHLEDFTIARLKFGTDKYKIGYLGGFVNSKYNLSGQLHNFDLRYQVTNQLEIKALAATTLIDGVNNGNSNIRAQLNYRTEKWNIFSMFQQKTPNFEQGLMGYPAVNNLTGIFTRVQRIYKFKNSAITRLRFNVGINYRSLYNLEVDRTRYFVMAGATFNLPSLGIINVFNGIQRLLGSTRYYNDEGMYEDNYGKFSALGNNHFRYWLVIETDASKTFSLFTRYINEVVKKALTRQYNIELTYKPSTSFKTTVGYRLYHIGESEFISEENRGFLSTLSLRSEYSITEKIFLKLYSQYNSQSERLSNNFVFSYEYLRGNFIYLAYADTGIFDNLNPELSYLKRYNLDRRTISLKWSYALYL